MATRRSVHLILAVASAVVLATITPALGSARATSTRAVASSTALGANTITVSTPSGAAIIQRNPFRIQFIRAGAGTALSEVANDGAAPALQLPYLYPTPLGGTPLKGSPRYAPLTFLVGDVTSSQWGGGTLFFQGNQSTGTISGIQYGAKRVLSAAPDGAGVTLRLSTDDPSGRVLIVTVLPTTAGALRVRVRPVPSVGVAYMADSFTSPVGESFHGFGGRHNGVDQAGHDFYSWIEEENSSGVPGGQSIEDAIAGQPGYMFPNGPSAAYTAHAMFVSSRPYGFLLNQPDFARWRLDSDQPAAWQVDVNGASLDYTVATGSTSSVISALTAISGRERVPPTWAIGPSLDRTLRAGTEQTPAQAQAEVLSDIQAIRRYHLSLDSYQLDAWYLLTPAQRRADVNALHALGIHVLRSFRAFTASPSAGWEDASNYAYATANHLVATHPDGTPAIFTAPYQNGNAALVDFTNPQAVAWWQRRVVQALDQGADGFMQDYGEQIDNNWRFHNGQTGAQMHNEYPILYDRATRRAIDRYMSTHLGRQIFFFTRAGYSGNPGSAAYENAEFLGDNTTSWDGASGIAAVVPDALNRGIGGAFGSDTDIGGYLDLLTPPTTPELFDRWAELSALMPFFRVHNSGETGTLTPWALGSRTLTIYRSMLALHRRAEPLILRLWALAAKTGLPVMRPLWLTDPADASGRNVSDEWALGPDVLVAPVVAQGASTRRVHFPHGCWRSASGQATYRGPSNVVVPAPLGELPYFIRCGTNPFVP